MKNPIALIGFMGSGKSAIGRYLAEQMHLSFYDLDEEIEKREKQSISMIFKTKGEEYFREVEKQSLMFLHQSCSQPYILSTGGGTPCYKNNMNYLKDHFTSIYISPSIYKLQQRLSANKINRPLVAQLNSHEILTYTKQKLIERNPFYSQADLIINPLHHDIQANALYIIKLIKSYQSLIEE